MDLSTISTALSSIKTATEIAKLIKNSDDTLEQAESKSLAEARIEVAEIQQVLSEKDTEIKKLKLQIAEKEDFQWEAPYYWHIDGSQKDGPFCQHCYDKYSEKIRLQGHGMGQWICAACKNSFADKSYQRPRVHRNSDWRL